MREELKRALFNAVIYLNRQGTTSIKVYEVTFQDTIERITGDLWWNVTSCNIFMHLLEHKDPIQTLAAIIDNLKEEYNQ